MRITVAALLLFLASCAGQPIVDMKGVDPAQYHRDVGECEKYADQVNVAGHTATGAVAGAVVGAMVGAVVGNHGTVERTAGAGAVVGGAKGTGRGASERHRVLHNCLRHRGYVVLN